MNKELNPEHAEGARKAYEFISRHIRLGEAVINAAKLLDGLEELETEKDEVQNNG